MNNKFDNHINVIDNDGKHLNPSYLHRAKGLVKNGRAEWVDGKTIKMLPPAAQVYTQTFIQFLNEKYTTFAEKWQTSQNIETFISEAGRKGLQAVKVVYQILDEYVKLTGETSPFAVSYRNHIRKTFEEPARDAVNAYKRAIVFIPEGTEIDPYFLGGLSNGEFVTAFKTLQQLVYDIYEEIERTSPFEWGWSGWSDMAAYGVWHNRVMGILGVFAETGEVQNDVLTVNKKEFFKHDTVKKQNQINAKTKISMIIAGLMDMGLLIEGFDDKKTDAFTISYPDTPHVITVLKSYFKEKRRECCQCHKTDQYPCMDLCDVTVIGHHKHIFSYRFVEKHPPTVDDTEILFLAVTDSAPDELRKIQFYLHDEALKHGYKIQPWTPAHGGSLRYCNYTDNWGSKSWLTVGSGTSLMDFFYTLGKNKWVLKTEFTRIFKKHPETADKLIKTYPEAYNHGDATFTLHNPTLDDVKIVLEVYKTENNIKPV